MRIIIIEDETSISQILRKGLKKEGFVVDCFADGLSGLEQLEILHRSYDLLILDVMLPKLNGLEVCQNLRKRNIDIPILMLTAKDALDDKVEGLNYGADDYLVKPFEYKELLARIKTLLRRPKILLSQDLVTSDLTLNSITRQVKRAGKELNLTTKEFGLLEYFFRHLGQVLSRDQIIDHAWNDSFDSFSNIVDAHIKNLRKKIDGEYEEKLFETIRGLGYRLRKLPPQQTHIQGGRGETIQLFD